VSVFVYPRAISSVLADQILGLDLDFPDVSDEFAPGTAGRRSSRTALIERTSASEWLYETAARLVDKCNRHLEFEMQGIEEPLQVIRYGPNDEVDWHIDVGGVGRPSRRKISISVQLSRPSDYRGGDIEFVVHPAQPFMRELGTAVCFPSYAAHRVSPVASGVRHSLVIFAHGERFR
jgi:PKHD-type hydroxylase